MNDLDPSVYLDAARAEFTAARPNESPSPAAVAHLARDAGYRAAVESAYAAGWSQGYGEGRNDGYEEGSAVAS